MKQGSAGSCLSWQSSWAEEGRSSGQEELPLPDDASHLVDESMGQLNSVGSDSFRQDTSLASQRQNSLLDSSSPSRRQGSPSLVGFSLRPSPRRNLTNSTRTESQPAFTSHQVDQSGVFPKRLFNVNSQVASPASSLSCSRSYFGGYRRSYTAYPGASWGGETLERSSRFAGKTTFYS